MTKFLAEVVPWITAGYREGVSGPANELPAPENIQRVRNQLAAMGWPLDDPRDVEESE